MIVRALYGLKLAGAPFRRHLAKSMGLLGYVRLTRIYGFNQKSDQKMEHIITPVYCVMWMTLIVYITM